MSRSVVLDGVILRGLRFGEADRILHVFTAESGHQGIVAKGARRSKSRYGGRMEPFFRLKLSVHPGRGDLATLVGAQTIEAHRSLRENLAALTAAACGCEAVLRLMASADPNPAAFNLLCRFLLRLDEMSAAGSNGESSPRAEMFVSTTLAFRLKLLIAAGFGPVLGRCARCGGGDVVAFSPSLGGVVCRECANGGFPVSKDAIGFMIGTVERPLASIEPAAWEACRQVDRAVVEIAAHHANVRVGRVVGPTSRVMMNAAPIRSDEISQEG